MMNETTEFDAIVIGSGITGGWAAKELGKAEDPSDSCQDRQGERQQEEARSEGQVLSD